MASYLISFSTRMFVYGITHGYMGGCIGYVHRWMGTYITSTTTHLLYLYLFYALLDVCMSESTWKEGRLLLPLAGSYLATRSRIGEDLELIIYVNISVESEFHPYSLVPRITNQSVQLSIIV